MLVSKLPLDVLMVNSHEIVATTSKVRIKLFYDVFPCRQHPLYDLSFRSYLI